MKEPKTNPLLRLMPSLTDVAFLMPVVFLFVRMEGMKSLLGDGDTGWHIRTGDWIRTHGQVPREDIFSYTMPGKPWYAWEWLWDVGASWIHSRWGLAGVALASLFVICLIFGLLYRLIYRRCGNPLISIGLTVLAASGATIHWLARPHLFTLLLTVVFMMILDRIREGKTALFWALPPLTILWTNLHGGFIFAFVLLGAYGAGKLVEALVASGRQERVASLKGAMRYFGTAAGCLAASLVNPYFYRLHVHIWEYFRDPYAMQNIAEFQSANFHDGAAGFLEAMLLLAAAASVWCVLRKRFGEAILMLGWAHLALIAARNIPIFMLVTAPLVATALVEVLQVLRRAPLAGWIAGAVKGLEEIGAEISPFEKVGRTHAVSGVVLLLLGLAVNAPGAGPKLKPEFDAKKYPAAALPALADSRRIFADDEWGDYLIYRLSPSGTKVYIDGRTDLYGNEFCDEYLDLVRVKYDWRETLDKHQVDTVLLRPSEPLASVLKESSLWRVAYDDGIAIVFRRAGQVSRHIQQVSTTGGKNDRRMQPVEFN